MTSEVPPRQSSNRKRSWSSGERRDNFFCTLSKTLIVAKLVSSTTSSYKAKNKSISISTEFQLKPKSPDIFQRDHLTSNLSSSQRWSCSSYGVFLELAKVESSDQEGNETQVSFSTYNKTMSLNRLYYHQVSDPMTEALAISGCTF